MDASQRLVALALHVVGTLFAGILFVVVLAFAVDLGQWLLGGQAPPTDAEMRRYLLLLTVPAVIAWGAHMGRLWVARH